MQVNGLPCWSGFPLRSRKEDYLNLMLFPKQSMLGNFRCNFAMAASCGDTLRWVFCLAPVRLVGRQLPLRRYRCPSPEEMVGDAHSWHQVLAPHLRAEPEQGWRLRGTYLELIGLPATSSQSCAVKALNI